MLFSYMDIWFYNSKSKGFTLYIIYVSSIVVLLQKMYYVNGSTIDLQALSYLPVFQSYWHIKNKAFQDEELVFCVVSEVSLKMTMKH